MLQRECTWKKKIQNRGVLGRRRFKTEVYLEEGFERNFFLFQKVFKS